MKLTSFSLLISFVFVLISCGDNKAATSDKQEANTSSPEKKENPASGLSAQEDDIIGEWDLVGAVVDTNDNLQIDEDERKKLESAAYKDYMKLNRDGSGLFTIAKMKGRYEITDPKSDGKKFLTWYDEANGPHRIGTILKVTKDELHIKEVGGSGLILWKRL
jgi:hypothetical protein